MENSNITGYLSPAAVSVAVITSIKIFWDNNKRKKVIGLLTSKPFLMNMLFIFSFVYYVFNIDDEDEKEIIKLKNAIRTALLGLIIAFMAYIDMVLAPFWIIFVASYYFDISG